jgi:CRISPR/Cas system-associated endonuclease Cas1
MAMGWRILDLTACKKASISFDAGHLVIDTNNEVDRVATADTAMLLLGTGVAFSTGVIHKFPQNDVVVLCCDWRNVPEAIITPFTNSSRVGQRQIAQANADKASLAVAWATIVGAKISGQSNTLRTVKPRLAQTLDKLVNQVELGDRTAIEAHAAKFY